MKKVTIKSATRPQPARRLNLALIWNALTIICLSGTLLVCLVAGLIFANPQLLPGPLQPPTDLPVGLPPATTTIQPFSTLLVEGTGAQGNQPTAQPSMTPNLNSSAPLTPTNTLETSATLTPSLPGTTATLPPATLTLPVGGPTLPPGTPTAPGVETLVLPVSTPTSGAYPPDDATLPAQLPTATLPNAYP